MRGRRRSVFIAPGGPVEFPDAREADSEGLVAVGGDLTVPRVVHAYDVGIFPWYDEGAPPLWWSPDPRAILEEVHVSRSLRRRLRRGGFELTHDVAFDEVMAACAERDGGGTWLIDEMLEAYSNLHRAGHAHSVEVWMEGELAGGIYGVHRGGLFAAESMFHRETDASKIALVAMHQAYRNAGIDVFDVQFMTGHLASMGAIEIPRGEYLTRVERVRRAPVSGRDLAAALAAWRPTPAE